MISIGDEVVKNHFENDYGPESAIGYSGGMTQQATHFRALASDHGHSDPIARNLFSSTLEQQNNFDDDVSYEVGQEETFTEGQLSMIQSSKKSLMKDSDSE